MSCGVGRRARGDAACSYQVDTVASGATDLTGPASLHCGARRESYSFPPGWLSVPYHCLRYVDKATPKAQHSLLRDQAGDQGQQLRAMGTWVCTTPEDTGVGLGGDNPGPGARPSP